MADNSFIENVNQIAAKLDIIEQSNSTFDKDALPILEDVASLELQEATDDLLKGTFFGNRKLDIDLGLNKQGVERSATMDENLLVWEDATTTVYYDKATCTFTDGTVIDVNFVNDDGQPMQLANHGTLVYQLLTNTAFTDKLVNTGIFDDIGGTTGSLVRVYDIVGYISNLERIELNAVAGNSKAANPVYYWAKSTSSFETLAMRAADIIKLGNDIDSIITLANGINEMLELQSALPELVENTESLYNNIAKLQEIHTHIQAIQTMYQDVRTGGTNYTNVVGKDLNSASSNVVSVGQDLQGSNTVGSVATNITNVNTIASNITSVSVVGSDLNAVSSKIKLVADNITAIQNAENNATIASNKAAAAADSADSAEADALIASNKASEATGAAQTATQKSDEIKNVSVKETITGAAGTNASVVYDSSIGKFTFVVPQGDKGDRGEAFEVNAVGLLSERSIYDDQAKGFSFLAIDEATIYFKMSATTADWSAGAPFGKGEKGDTGDTGNGVSSIAPTSTTNPGGTYAIGGFTDTYTISYTDGSTSTFTVYNGNGIASITFDSTTDPSGLKNEPGATDTWLVTYTDGSTTTFTVYNGQDSAVLSVAGRTGDVVINEADISDLDKYTQAQIDTKIETANKQAIAMTIALS